ncbi:MAG: CoA-binding protein [Pseudomonadota bacterium]
MTVAYPDGYIADILNSVKTVALVGASADETRASHRVLRFLRDAGYEMLPVNPRLDEVLGLRVYPSLAAIDQPVDMVDVFRRKERLYGVAEQAIEIGAKVLWGQLGVYDDAAAGLAEEAGMKVVMDRCPKIELQRMEVPG